METHDLLPADCVAARRRLSLAADGELPAPERELLDRHIAFCPSCEAWAADLQVLVSAVRGSALEQVGRELHVPRRRLPLSGVAGAVAAAAAITVAVLSTQIHSTPLVITVQLSPVAVKSQLTLKEQQLSALDADAAAAATRARPSVPPGILVSS